jgi:hypothetical protein
MSCYFITSRQGHDGTGILKIVPSRAACVQFSFFGSVALSSFAAAESSSMLRYERLPAAVDQEAGFAFEGHAGIGIRVVAGEDAVDPDANARGLGSDHAVVRRTIKVRRG